MTIPQAESVRNDARSPRRVALFTGNYNLVPDGVSITLNRLVAFLRERGRDVLVFGPRAGRGSVPHVGRYVPVRSIPLPTRGEYRISLGLSGAARRHLVAFDPDLVHIATPDLLGWRALRFARRRGIPVVASYHTHFPSYLRYYRLQALEGLLWVYLRHFYSQCEHVYVASPAIREVLEARGIRERVHLWERGVDALRFHPGKRSLDWRRAQGVEDEEVVVLFVGRLVREKALALLAAVAQRLASRSTSCRLVVVGEGPERPTLQREAPGSRLLGHLEGDALAAAYASSDLFLFPSETETLGNVTLEAMASALPTVCADAPGSDYLVEDGVTGFLVRPGDADGFADRVITLASDPELRRSMGIEARRRAEESRWDVTLERLMDLYGQAMGPVR